MLRRHRSSVPVSTIPVMALIPSVMTVTPSAMALIPTVMTVTPSVMTLAPSVMAGPDPAIFLSPRLPFRVTRRNCAARGPFVRAEDGRIKSGHDGEGSFRDQNGRSQ